MKEKPKRGWVSSASSCLPKNNFVASEVQNIRLPATNALEYLEIFCR